MAEHPILFNSEMVRAILDGRKTQTRRVIKPQPYETEMCPVIACVDVQSPSGYIFASHRFGDRHIKPTYGQVGDKLWVRESYQINDYSFRRNCVGGKYLADNKEFWTEVYQREYDLIHNRKFPSRPTSGRFMYKSLTRIWLEITNIRVKRVQDISGEDAQKEGWPRDRELYPTMNTNDKARRWFWILWNSINTKRGFGWDANPWVWVIEFKVEKRVLVGKAKGA